MIARVFTTMIARMFTTHDRPYVYHPSPPVCLPPGKSGYPVAQCLQAHQSLEDKTMERLHMNHLREIIHRLQKGESGRRIARDMRISRPTVHKYHQLAEREGYLEPGAPLPDNDTLQATLGPGPQPPRTPSTLEPYREVVTDYLKLDLEMTAIWQRLRDNYGYTGSYSAVRRFVRHLAPTVPEAFVRVNTGPGEDLQVDFKSVGPLYDPATGRLRTAYAFVATLCYSRHQYAELVFDQKVPTWIALHRRAFEFFGGVPRRIIPDNLKAAVLEALVYDPVLGEAYRQMGLHYGFLISPTTPGVPRHKGKVESGVHYVQRNFMAGQQFADIHCANRRLQTWVMEVAGVREHGTTHQPPLLLFRETEQAALLPLPDEPFSLSEIRMVKVHSDCHVSIDGSYYSVPYTFVGQKLDAYIHERIVELFQGQHLVATHVRCREPGQWQTRLDHYPPHKAEYLRRTPDYCRQIASRIGPSTHQVVEALLADRPLDRLRSVQAILRLEETVGPKRLEAACARALYYGDVRYRRIKEILNAALDRDPLPETPDLFFNHPYIFARSSTEFFGSRMEGQS
jgi:transposase